MEIFVVNFFHYFTKKLTVKILWMNFRDNSINHVKTMALSQFYCDLVVRNQDIFKDFWTPKEGEILSLIHL